MTVQAWKDRIAAAAKKGAASQEMKVVHSYMSEARKQVRDARWNLERAGDVSGALRKTERAETILLRARDAVRNASADTKADPRYAVMTSRLARLAEEAASIADRAWTPASADPED